MARNMMKKLLCLGLATTCTFGSVAMLSACETSHPEVTMTLSFDGEDYELTYKLYRKLTPATTTHFLELVDGGYYDGLCVHDYQDSVWYTGVYSYDANKADEGGLVYKNYFETAKNLNLTSTVWKDEAQTESTYTLYGEFSSNNFRVENGKIQNSFGALTMRYTDKGSAKEETVWVKTSGAGSVVMQEYGYNSATSMFSIATSTSATNAGGYCTFAILKDDEDIETLEELQKAVKAYIDEVGDASDFAPSVTVTINEDDEFAGSSEKSYAVPVEPIVIKQMKVTKW
jgi:cyclophilin family peptidyl-prolyl cis-trans isomerase